MKTLILSDIHANEPALQAVLQEASPWDRIVFLGDLANFGPHPCRCVELLKELNPICIMGNHDAQIVSPTPKHFWDKWSKTQLSDDQQCWITAFPDSMILDGHILLIHGIYSVDYDILPNTPDRDIVAAFRPILPKGVDQVWFGHYHYQVDRLIDGVEYHCIRPVGHHRDWDTRAGYSLYEDGVLTHKRVEYQLSKTIEDFEKMDIFEENEVKSMFSDMLKHEFHEKLLQKDLQQMMKNEHCNNASL